MWGSGLTHTEPETKPSRRLLWTVIVLTAGAAGLLWAASALVWVGQNYQTPFTGVRFSGASGAVLRPELVPLALLSLAAIAALLATSGLLRRVIGLLVAVAGGVLAWRVIEWYQSGWFAYLAPDVPPGSTPIGEVTANPAGPVLMSLAAALLVAAGVLVLVRAARMPGMGAKYSAPGAAKRKPSDPDKLLWDALDEGTDPTEGEPGRN